MTTPPPTASPTGDTEEREAPKAESAKSGGATEILGRSPGKAAWARLRRDRVAMVSLVITVLFILVAVFAPVLTAMSGWGPITSDISAINPNVGNFPYGHFGGISLKHLLGVEPGTGFDLYARIVYGMRISLIVGFVSAVVSTVLGVVVGLAAGYFGGWIDNLLSRIMDIVLGFPQLLFIIALSPVLSSALSSAHGGTSENLRLVILVINISAFAWAYTARLVRGQALSLREREFIDASRIMGARPGHILFKQLLPNLWAPIMISFALAVPTNITTEAALSYLGVGVVPPSPDLGSLLNAASEYFLTDPTYLFIPGVLLLVLVLALNLLGDGVRDALDPRSNRS